jgi:3-(3-hydroxy-phenyl)propionate hydroxylase
VGQVPQSTDVLLVGFGPGGAAIANLLGTYGVRTLVVDKAPEIFMAPRAIALDNEALRILQLAGLPEGAFETLAIPYVRMRCPYVGEFGCINTAGSIDGHPKLVTFYQPQLEHALRKRLEAHACVRTVLGVELTGFTEQRDAISATLRLPDGTSRTVQARYLIGADGAKSLVRQLIGEQFEGQTYAEDWLIVDAWRPGQTIDHVEFICDPKRPTPHMSAPGDRERWEFMLHPGESREQMESDDSIRTLLAPWGRPEDMNIERRAVYRFQARVAKRFRKGRVFLAGDAAHITPPFVGQGLVAGLRDAANLSWKLAWVLKGLAAESILDSYDTERRPHAKAMIDLAKLMGRLVMPGNPVAAMVIHGLMRLLRRIPPIRAYFEELEIKPKNRFASGLFVRGRSRSKLVRGGLLPQGWLRTGRETIRLSDDVLGPTLTLIGFGQDPVSLLDSNMATAFLAAGGETIQICHRGQRLHRSAGNSCWEDLDDTFIPTVVPFGWAAVVRPDRTVLHDGPIAEVNRLVGESLKLLGRPAASAASSAPAVAARAH